MNSGLTLCSPDWVHVGMSPDGNQEVTWHGRDCCCHSVSVLPSFIAIESLIVGRSQNCLELTLHFSGFCSAKGGHGTKLWPI